MENRWPEHSLDGHSEDGCAHGAMPQYLASGVLYPLIVPPIAEYTSEEEDLQKIELATRRRASKLYSPSWYTHRPDCPLGPARARAFSAAGSKSTRPHRHSGFLPL